MAPLGGKPAVIEVKPSDHGANVESCVDWVELERSSWDLGSIGNDGAGDNGPKKLRALLEAQSLETTAQGIQKNPSSGVELNHGN